jgi:hypothetical protein
MLSPISRVILNRSHATRISRNLNLKLHCPCDTPWLADIQVAYSAGPFPRSTSAPGVLTKDASLSPNRRKYTWDSVYRISWIELWMNLLRRMCPDWCSCSSSRASYSSKRLFPASELARNLDLQLLPQNTIKHMRHTALLSRCKVE